MGDDVVMCVVAIIPCIEERQHKMNRRDVALEHQEMDDRKESLAIEYGWLFASSRCRSMDLNIDNAP
jgi:hypothetical protein